METFLIRALQLILSLSILVLVHEFGHFIFARIFKVRVEKFYLFFDPWFSLFKFKPKNSDTEYGIGWLPLGGYCKISGMIDESMDKEAMAQPAKPYEFRSKPAGQRLMIMIAGVLFNFLLALFIYSMVLYTWGETYLPLKNMKHGMYYSEAFQEVGFRDGDILLKANNEELDRLDQSSFRKVVEASNVTVLRDGVETVIPIPEDMMQRFMREGKGFASPDRVPMVVKKLSEKDSPAATAGLQPGDSIVSINGQATPLFEDVAKMLDQNKGKDITLGFYRNGMEQSVVIQPDTAGKIGVYLMSKTDLYPTVTRTYGFFESFPAGVRLGINTLKGYVNDEPGYETMELMEDSVLYKLERKQLKELFLDDLHIANWGRRYAEMELLATEERLISMLSAIASERYKELLEKEPDLLQRLPLGSIATYLGVTQASLSRIRAKITQP